MTIEDVQRYFLYFSDQLSVLGYTEELAASVFIQDYFSAWCPYTDEYIPSVFQRVALDNIKRYDMMLEIFSASYDPLVNYDRTETESSTRTPNLTTSSSGQAADNNKRETLKRGIEHRADKGVVPEGSQDPWSETTEHSVAPFDNQTLRVSDEDKRTENGWREIQTSTEYPDNKPDVEETLRTSNHSDSKTETGTDTTIRRLSVSGNIGTVTAQDMANQQLDLAERMNLFRIIEADLAAKLFIQVWN